MNATLTSYCNVDFSGLIALPHFSSRLISYVLKTATAVPFYILVIISFALTFFLFICRPT